MVLELFLDATFIVQSVMLSLICLSIYSWTLIVSKKKELINREKEIKFLNSKISGIESQKELLSQWYSLSNSDGYFLNIIYKTKDKIKNINSIKKIEDLNDSITYIKENMDLLIDREIQKLRKQTVILATIGSVSPYIGLFGTVWGIMNSFIAIGVAKQATLEYVAPGIAEALIATAIGLFAAIPAYIFYNVISNKIDEISEEYDLLKDEFLISAKGCSKEVFNKKRSS